MTGALLAAALAFTPAEAHLSYETARILVERHTPRDGGTPRAREAARAIYDAINATGLDASYDSFRETTPSGMRFFTNVVSEYVSDPADPWLVFVSHYDTKPGVACPGANDGASTSGLLVGLGAMLFDQRPRGVNVMLLWTDGEECQKAYDETDGFWGARHAAERLKKDGRQVLCVVCLDMLGDRDLKISIPGNGSPGARRTMMKVARQLGLEDRVELSERSVKDDHMPFLRAGFRAVDLIDFDYGSTPGANDWWHTPEDTMDKISEASLLVAGRLATGLVDGLRR